MGRPTKLTPELQKKICDDVASGISMEAAAGAAGISETTLYDWLRRGRDGRKPYMEFVEELYKARSECEASLLKVVTRHAVTDWRAAQWLLSVKHPQRYGNLTKYEVRQELRFAGMTDAELDAYIVDAERTLGEAGAGRAPGTPALPLGDDTD